MEISIPLDFCGEQPNTYDVDKASAKAYKAGEFVGDTRQGGGCNFEEYKLIPHCNGTHTECVGHISYERISIDKTLKEVLIPSTLITLTPENSIDTKDTYFPVKNDNDFLITEKILSECLKNAESNFLEALVIRTVPNTIEKKSRNYMKEQPSFLSIEAAKFISKLNIKHLILDIPSLDRTFDEGKLTAHHIFWDVQLGSHDVEKENHSLKTITEMAFIPVEIKDGNYLLNIQIPGFNSDAAPSRLFLFAVS